MIATRHLFVWGRKLEMELRVHVVQPEQQETNLPAHHVECAAAQLRALRDADRRQAHWERVWLEQGIHS